MNPYELNPKFKDALIKMNFIEKYAELSNRFTAERTPWEKRKGPMDIKKIKSVFEKVGYPATFHTGERFFRIKKEVIGDFTFIFNFVFRNGVVELIWGAWEKDELLIGSPWGGYAKDLTNNEVNIRPPVYGSYEDLEEILRYVFEMYEEFKEILINS